MAIVLYLNICISLFANWCMILLFEDVVGGKCLTSTDQLTGVFINFDIRMDDCI